jgi:hypothetical protein
MANGLLGKAVSVANQFVQAYQVPAAGVEFATVSIHVLNKDTAIGRVDIAVGPTDTPEDVDFISFKDELVAEGGVVEHNCFLLSPGERVLVRSDNAQTIIRVHGLEKLAIA